MRDQPESEKTYSLLPIESIIAPKLMEDSLWQLPKSEVDSKFGFRLRNSDNNLFQARNSIRDIFRIRGQLGADFNAGFGIGHRILQFQAELPGAVFHKPDPEVSRKFIDKLKDNNTSGDIFKLENQGDVEEKDYVFTQLIGEYAEHRSSSSSYSEHKEILLGGLALYQLIAHDIEQREIQDLKALFAL